MDPELRSTLVKLGLPLLGCAFVLFAARRRGMSLRDDVGVRWPGARSLVLWIVLWVAWVAAFELLTRAVGMGPPPPWSEHTPLVFCLRVVAIGLVGPALEELLFRGVLLHVLARSRLGPRAAVAILAATWAALHFGSQDWRFVLVTFLDGVFLGTARLRTRSVVVPIALHMIGNFYSIWQSTSGAS